jgi:hypothetical protein
MTGVSLLALHPKQARTPGTDADCALDDTVVDRKLHPDHPRVLRADRRTDPKPKCRSRFG